ncbi:MAG TPA: hypothetical protein P5539_11965 [Mesotoga sp.]|nr:hypothetical protein [Mesotoga sp.]
MSVKLEGHRMLASWKSRALTSVESYVDEIIVGRLIEAKYEAIDTLKQNDNIVTHELAHEKSFEIVKTKGGQLTTSWYLTNTAPHAPYVERGTRPHYPPLRALIDFVVRKHGLSEREAWPVAVEIQKTIGTKGTKPYPFMRPAFEKMRVKLKKDLRRFSKDSGVGGRAFTRYYGE